MARKVNRSAITGRLVSKDEAKANPETTISETIEVLTEGWAVKADGYMVVFDTEIMAKVGSSTIDDAEVVKISYKFD